MHSSTHFDLSRCLSLVHTHPTPKNLWDKSLWDLPPRFHSDSHTLPIHLSLDTLRCKNNMAALKKAPGERRHGSQKHFCLFLMAHPRKPGQGYLSQTLQEKKKNYISLLFWLADYSSQKCIKWIVSMSGVLGDHKEAERLQEKSSTFSF